MYISIFINLKLCYNINQLYERGEKMRNFQLFNLIISVPAVLIAFTVQGYAKALVEAFKSQKGDDYTYVSTCEFVRGQK